MMTELASAPIGVRLRGLMRALVCSAAAALLAAGVAGARDDDAGGEIALGAADAPVELVLYHSPSCRDCAEFFQAEFENLRRDYVEPGRVRIVFREFISAPSRPTMAASMLARCAGLDDGTERYLGVIAVFHARRSAWTTDQDPLIDSIAPVAAGAGIDRDAIEACFTRRGAATAITEGMKQGEDDYGVTAVPAFVVDGVRVEGTAPWVDESKWRVRRALDEALAARGVSTP